MARSEQKIWACGGETERDDTLSSRSDAWRLKGEANEKGGPYTFFTVNGYRTAVSIYDVLHDLCAESGAAGLPADGADCEEAVADLRRQADEKVPDTFYDTFYSNATGEQQKRS